MTERKLATVSEIVEKKPIAGADLIEAVRVRNWWVVTQKDEFNIGDKTIYLEIDSFCPIDRPVFAHLAKFGVKNVRGVKGHVLKTIRLRGQYSQGLVLSPKLWPEVAELINLPIGTDVSEQLGVMKFEPPIPAELNGKVIGAFLGQFCPKTDAMRVQNLAEVWPDIISQTNWVATEKIDGTSVTYVMDAEQLRVCSRNYELAESDVLQWQIAAHHKLAELLKPGEAIQGELFGDGIQSNRLGIVGKRLAAFSFWRDRSFVPRAQWPKWLLDLAVPQFDLLLPETIAEAVSQADGIKSVINPSRLAEGVVWHSSSSDLPPVLDGLGCFKVISNKWLLKYG